MSVRSPYANLLNTSPRPRWYFSEEIFNTKEGSNATKDKIIVWNPYDWKDSDHIESDYFLKSNNSHFQTNKVINFDTMNETTNGDTASYRKVLRGTWFFKGDDNNGTMVPYSAEISEILEKEFLLGNFQKKEITHKPPRDVIMYADITFKQYRRTKHADPLGRDVERGFNRGVLRIYPGYHVPPHTQVFRVDLNVLMSHPMNANHRLPVFFESCVAILMDLGPKTEGIFRLSGSVDKIEEIKRAWDSGEVVDLSSQDINDVAGLLKLFIRELPDPLCKRNLIKSWFSIVRDGDMLQQIRSLLNQLPEINLKMFGELFKLLWKIASANEITKMGPSNLAICWAPNLFPSTEGFAQAQQLTTAMIEHVHDLFKD